MHFMDQLVEIGRPNVEMYPWMHQVEMYLGTVELLGQIEEECKAAGRVALDLETTGLDQRAFPMDNGQLVTNDKIVGYCIAPTAKKGYYIPVRHREKGADANVPDRLVVAMLNRLQEAGVVFVFHNAKFDQKFLQYSPAGRAGEWDDPKSWDDTLILAYLRNSRQRSKGLKYLSKEELGREMIELKQLFLPEQVKAKKLDFATLDPRWEPVVWYAAADAINTLALYEILAPVILARDKFQKSQKTVYTIEKICSTATRWMEQCRIFIDRAKLVELIQLGQKEWWECLQEVYTEVSSVLSRDIRPGWVKSMAPYDHTILSPDYMEVRELAKRQSMKDMQAPIKKSVPSLTDRKVRETVDFPYVYDITIPAEFGQMLRELGVEGLEATEKSGQVKTSKEILERVIKDAGDKHAWMKKVKRFREIAKALGNVLFNIYHDTAPDRSPDGCVWANFNGTKVDTGRFSTPTPREKKFFGQVNWNVQSTKAYYYNPKDPPPDCVYRQREVIAARPGYILFAIDFSGVELRIVTNLSGEPKWLAEFFRCSSCENEFEKGSLPPPFCPNCGSDKIGDLHSLTTVGIYGEKIKDDSKLFKLKRQIGKIVNFLLCYGGSGNAVQRSTGVDKEEGWRIKNQFDKTYKGLLRWWRKQEVAAKKQLYVTTAFGRKYPVPDIIHENNRFRSKAKRNAVNGPVQGTSADIMKLAMGLLYREFKKRGWVDRGPGLPDLVLMTITIHDELVFEIHESIVKDAIPVIEHIMCVDTVKNLDWIVPLKVDIEFGSNWTVPFNLTEMTWNQGGGDWTPRLVGLFPDRYQNYLENGGKAIDADGVEPQPSQFEAAVEPPKPDPVQVQPPEAPAEVATEVVTEVATEVVTEVAPAPNPVSPIAPPPPPAQQELTVEREGDIHVYRLPRHRMTPANAQKLARVISRCIGRGVDTLRISDDAGNDLLGSTVRVAVEEFKVIAAYEGL
jgi:DNA polymerase I-like protein with 3'-5' exonuclease and polymerase domains